MTQVLVVDCSAAIPWFLEDEANKWSERLLNRLPQHTVHVPALFHLEFPNVLLTAERRGRIDADTRLGLIARAAHLPLHTDNHVVSILEISRLAVQYNITTYDAAYLELAIRLASLLATQDKALAKAATKCGVSYSNT